MQVRTRGLPLRLVVLWMLLLAPLSTLPPTAAVASSGDARGRTGFNPAADAASPVRGKLHAAPTARRRGSPFPSTTPAASPAVRPTRGQALHGHLPAAQGGTPTAAPTPPTRSTAPQRPASPNTLNPATTSAPLSLAPSAAGIITTVAGTGSQGYSGDGGPAP